MDNIAFEEENVPNGRDSSSNSVLSNAVSDDTDVKKTKRQHSSYKEVKKNYIFDRENQRNHYSHAPLWDIHMLSLMPGSNRSHAKFDNVYYTRSVYNELEKTNKL